MIHLSLAHFSYFQDRQLLSLYVLVHIHTKDNFVQCIEAVPETIELFGFFWLILAWGADVCTIYLGYVSLLDCCPGLRRLLWSYFHWCLFTRLQRTHFIAFLFEKEESLIFLQAYFEASFKGSCEVIISIFGFTN